ncbi:MAG: hypothetical protein FJ264_08690 [Planctomycetes bacterium]|nr:hypothetical protein [Planctomycetota bacterium]
MQSNVIKLSNPDRSRGGLSDSDSKRKGTASTFPVHIIGGFGVKNNALIHPALTAFGGIPGFL